MKNILSKKLFIIFLSLGCIIATLGFYVWHGLRPLPPRNDNVFLTVNKGMGSATIAKELYERGIIRSPFLFRVYLKWYKEGSEFKAGTYEVQPGITLHQVITKLKHGHVTLKGMNRCTIPEGYNVFQMANKLHKEVGVNKQQFLRLCNSQSEFKLPILKKIPKNEGMRYVFEGYLFPDTYCWKKEIGTKEIITSMLLGLQKKLDTMENWSNIIRERGISFHEWLTIASIIEREVTVEKERPLVASVIFNRLHKNMRLEMDATVSFLFHTPKKKISYDDLNTKSPYNTYRNKGLPPGPICSPGSSSMRAVLYPVKSDYLFYVTKKDGTGEHHFAKTYKEHQVNIAKSKQTSNDKRGE